MKYETIHEVPQVWLDVTRVFSAEIQEVCPHWANFKLTAAYKGGWKKGYTWDSGKFRLEIYANTYGRNGLPHKQYKTYILDSIEGARKAFDRAEKYGVRTESKGYYLVCLYRDGIADSKFAKRVTKTIKERFPKIGRRMSIYTNPEVQKYAENRAFALLHRRGYELDISGICNPDNTEVFDDLGIWSNPPKPEWAML